MNWVDYLSIAYLLWGVVTGYRRGLVRSVMGLGGYVLALAVAVLYSTRFARWLGTNFGLTGAFEEFAARVMRLPAAGDLPLLPDPIARVMGSLPDRDAALAAEALVKAAGSMLTQAVAFMILLVAIKLAINMVSAALHGMLSIGPLAFPNRLGGAVAGLLYNGAALVAVFGIAMPLLSLSPGSSWNEYLGSSLIALASARVFAILLPLIFNKL